MGTYSNGTFASGYSITTQNFTLGPQGSIGGNGLFSAVTDVTFVNFGTVTGTQTPTGISQSAAVYLYQGGSVTNGASGNRAETLGPDCRTGSKAPPALDRAPARH